jgi:hypothetical protein
LPLDSPAIFRAAVTPQDAPGGVYLFELSGANLGAYSPSRFVKAATAGEIADRIRENKDRLDDIAMVSADVRRRAQKQATSSSRQRHKSTAPRLSSAKSAPNRRAIPFSNNN